MTRWTEWAGAERGASYDERWQSMKAAGESIHGEADLIAGYGPDAVLDAGCGTGRVAIELAHRGIDAVGVDIDEEMLAHARDKAPGLTWIAGDLVDVTVPDGQGGVRQFDVVALAGNVMIFLTPGTEDAVLANLARHVGPGGRLIAGFQLLPQRLSLPRFDAGARAAEFEPEDRWATWDRRPFTGGDYAVSVLRRPSRA